MNTLNPHVLLVEDTPELILWVGTALRQAGMQMTFAQDGWAAQKSLQTGHGFDAVVLDLQIPGPDGLAVLEGLRARGDEVPVLILTARASVPDRVLGLNLGADDYLPKPFELTELEARLAALLRRRGGKSAEAKGTSWRLGLLSASASSPEVLYANQPLPLTPREGAALRVLLRAAPTVSKEALHHEVFGEDGSELDAVEVLIHRLRKKLDALHAEPLQEQAKLSISTIRGLGYLLTLRNAGQSG
ncbi:MAG: response regulator transcription factor [Brachymonas sp.]|nr:response regulator transcription factor [Brachymonas sp.]